MPNGNKAEQAYDEIESMITFQELPPGSLLSESMLMQHTGLGRTPVREAVQRLARERMVEIHPSRGVFVAHSSVESQLKLLELRRNVEELAVRLAARRASTRQRNEMNQLADELSEFDHDDIRQFGLLLKRTHEAIANAAQNEFLLAAMAPLQGLSRRFWFAHLREPAAELAVAAQLHSAVLRALWKGDEAEAAASSLRLNDYLVEFAYGTVGASSYRGPD